MNERYENLFFSFKVKCPRDIPYIYDMSIRVLKKSDGTLIPAPCNGCEWMNGMPECSRCIESIFKMSLMDPTMQSFEQPIIP